MQSVEYRVLSRIYGKKRGWVFTPNHFKDLGSRSAVDLSLHRLADKGTIRRLARGVYDYPAKHGKLGLLAPSTDAVAAALKERDAARIMPSGAYAANALGLSEQVPMRIVYLTDGRGRSVSLGARTIHLKKTTPRNLATSGRASGLVIQALRHIGRDRVDQTVVDRLRDRLSEADKDGLIKDLAYAPAWMGPIFQAIANPSGRD